MFLKLASLPRKIKILIVLLCDIVLLPLAFWSSIALRLGTWDPPVSTFWWLFLTLPVLTVPLFIKLGLYRAVIRYLDDKIIYTVVYGVTLSVFFLTTVIVMGQVAKVPRSSIIIYWVMAIAYIASSRFIARGLMLSLERTEDRRQPVVIYGAGKAGMQTALALMSGPEFRPVAFVDDNRDLHGASVVGIRVYNSMDTLKVMESKRCRQLLIAMPSASRARKKEIIQKFEREDIAMKTLPGMGELVDGRVRTEDIRDVGVEDLLGRDPVPPYEHLIKACIEDRVVLVTGAGGSIGSELCRQITLCAPKSLILLERSEYALYRMEQELLKHHPYLKVHSILGDVLDFEFLKSLIAFHKVNTVYHAAAYKHVPLVEGNIVAGLRNNVLGTWSSVLASIQAGVDSFVLISTDKAVRPTNIMGASKRLAELVLQALAKSGSGKTRVIMVRFGNVLGSSGSVVPLFKDQIRAGGPVTVTHPEVTRYFMTIPEAAQLVLQAGSMGEGGDVFVLDMGDPVKIIDLARKMIELSGLDLRDQKTGRGDISIEYIGLRPGEKLYEELLIGDNVLKTEHPRIMRAMETMMDGSILFAKLEEMKSACEVNDIDKIKSLLRELVVEYQPAQGDLST